MAKFKKKKSKPMGDEEKPVEGIESVDSTKQPSEQPFDSSTGQSDSSPEQPSNNSESTKAPPTEDVSKGDPPVNLEQQNEKDSKLNKLFWMRVAIAAIAGIAATFVFDSIEGEERRWASIAFMIIVFIATIIVAKQMRIPFSLADRKKLVTQGIGSYVFVYLFMWILSYTLVNVGNVESTAIFP